MSPRRTALQKWIQWPKAVHPQHGKCTQGPQLPVYSPQDTLFSFPLHMLGNYGIKGNHRHKHFLLRWLHARQIFTFFGTTGERPYLDYTQGNWLEAEVSGQAEIRSDLAWGDLKLGPGASVQRRLTPTPHFQDPGDGINNSCLSVCFSSPHLDSDLSFKHFHL